MFSEFSLRFSKLLKLFYLSVVGSVTVFLECCLPYFGQEKSPDREPNRDSTEVVINTLRKTGHDFRLN